MPPATCHLPSEKPVLSITSPCFSSAFHGKKNPLFKNISHKISCDKHPNMAYTIWDGLNGFGKELSL